MKKTFMENTILRVSLYLFGIIVTSLGANILLRAELGAGAWDTVFSNFRYLAHITLGTASLIVNVVVLSLVMILNKSFKYVLVLIPIFGIALFNDFWDILIFGDMVLDELWLQAVFFAVGIVVLPLGLASMVVTKYPAMVYDELTLIFMRIFHVKSFFKIRIGIEMFAVILATLFGFLAGIRFGSVNYGSLILALSVGPIVSIHMHWLTKVLHEPEISSH